MKALQDRILKDGRCIGTDVLKVDSFLNHQIDVRLVEEMGREFAGIFKGLGVNKILTIETSGIPMAYATARAMGDLPLVFAKKTTPSTMIDGVYSAEVRSFTKGTVSHVIVSEKYLSEGDVVLLIDDFLAHGEAASGLYEICLKAGAKCVGLGAAIEKKYQGGAEIQHALLHRGGHHQPDRHRLRPGRERGLYRGGQADDVLLRHHRESLRCRRLGHQRL